MDRVGGRRGGQAQAPGATQATQGLLALALGILALAGVVELWMVWILALGLGITRAFDTPTRQAFVSELVQGPSLARAIGINSTVVSAARMIGPAAGGAIIAVFGVGVCFLINAASFVGPLAGLPAMDVSKLYRSEARGARARRRGPGRAVATCAAGVTCSSRC